MTRLRLRNESGQAITLTVIALTGIIGMTALVLDVGSWFRAQRKLQSIADAAALAGAQALPESTSDALGLAQANGTKNSFTINGASVTFTTKAMGNDTIQVKISEDQPGFFARVFGVNKVKVGATGVARAYNLGEARYVAPIAVDKNHPLLHCSNGAKATCNPTFGQETTLDLLKLKKGGGSTGAGNFGLIDLANGNGSVGSGDLASWIQYGYNDPLPLGTYQGVPSAKYHDSQMKGALEIRTGDVLLFPVYSSYKDNGSNLTFNIIGWVGFRVTGFDTTSADGTLTGTFESYVAQGLESSDSSEPYLGVKKVTLVG